MPDDTDPRWEDPLFEGDEGPEPLECVGDDE